jgi:2-polyprenyl-3-methyl-5-hydroxy-6-metoxy-1,4-benzoquinol methylase
MRIIPWRVKNFLSDRIPLAYHLIANRGLKANSPRYWDRRLAETWDAPNRYWPAKIEVLTTTLDRDMSILDVGCGTGSILLGLQRHGFTNLHGLEQSDYAIRRLTEQAFAITKGNFLDPPFPHGTFDAVIASEVLEHVIRRKQLLHELTRIVRPAGSILIFVPDNYLGPIDEPEHVLKYDAGSLRAFLTKFVFVESVRTVVEPHSGARSLFAVCRNNTTAQHPRNFWNSASRTSGASTGAPLIGASTG